MSKTIFKVMGSLVVSFAIVFILGGTVTALRYHMRKPSDLALFVALSLTLVLVGVGLYNRRKWAGLGFSLLALYAAFWEVQGAIHPIPGYWSWLGFVWAAMLVLPSFVVAKYWSTLVWGGPSHGSDSL